MAVQAIFYDAQGQVTGVLDPMGDYDLPAQEGLAAFVLAKGCSISGGVLRYEKIRDQAKRVLLGNTWHELYDWQKAVDTHLGKA